VGTYRGDDDCLYLNVYTPKVRGYTDATSYLRYKIGPPSY
jgi:carboxylesterase type B